MAIVKLTASTFKSVENVEATTKEKVYDYEYLKRLEKRQLADLAKTQALIAQGEASGIDIEVDLDKPIGFNVMKAFNRQGE